MDGVEEGNNCNNIKMGIIIVMPNHFHGIIEIIPARRGVSHTPNKLFLFFYFTLIDLILTNSFIP